MIKSLHAVVLMLLITSNLTTSNGFARQVADQPASTANCPGWPFPLTGSQETPPVVTPGMGSAVIGYNITTNTITWQVSYNGLLGSVTGAHIHAGAVGVAGPVEVNIGAGGLASPMMGSAVLTDPQEVNLLQGNLYINIHTTNHPGGEVRGQIPAPTFQLSGANEVPPINALATGFMVLFLDSSNNLSWYIQYTNLSGLAQAAHFHQAPAGVNGPAVIDIGSVSGLTPPMIGTTALTYSQLLSLRSDQLYVNIHSSAYPSGEIRAQIDGCHLTGFIYLPLLGK